MVQPKVTEIEIEVTPSAEISALGVCHVRRFWEKAQARKSGRLAQDALQEEWTTDVRMLSALGLGIEQTFTYLFQSSETFEDFESWILATRSAPMDGVARASFNLTILDEARSESESFSPPEQVLTAADLEFWSEHGFVIVREAVSKEECQAAETAVWEHLGMGRDNPATWYRTHPDRQGIMVQLFQHPALEVTRYSEKVRKAYAELWGTERLWVSTDRVGFNPPETPTWKFPGPRLHWDVSLELPIPFGTQGVLYLTDTAAEQGALTLVPGFQNKIEAWLQNLPQGSDPRRQDLYELGAKGIAAQAGDFIIWHQALPHGSRPNLLDRPRIVQYVNWQPVDPEVRKQWK